MCYLNAQSVWKLRLLLYAPKVSVRVVLPELRAKLFQGKEAFLRDARVAQSAWVMTSGSWD